MCLSASVCVCLSVCVSVCLYLHEYVCDLFECTHTRMCKWMGILSNTKPEGVEPSSWRDYCLFVVINASHILIFIYLLRF